MSPSVLQFEEWEHGQLEKTIDWEGCQIDPAPFQLVERTSLHKVHSLFSLLGLNHAYVTNTGRLVGVVALKELRHAIQGNLDAEATRKHRPVVEEESEDDDYEDPQNLQVLHPDTPDGYTLVSNNRFDIESADEKEKSSVV